MSAYKKLNRQDVFLSDYVAKKAWYATGSYLSEYGIETLRGFSGSTPGYPYPHDYRNNRYESIVFNSANHNYYSNTTGSIINGRVVYDISGSTLYSGSFDISPTTTLDLSGSRVVKTEVGIISVPRTVYGIGIEPGTIRIEHFTESQDKYVIDGFAVDQNTGANQFIEDVKYWYNSTPIDTGSFLVSESNYVYENQSVSGSYLGEYIEETTGSMQHITIIDDKEGRLIISGSENVWTLPERHVGDVMYNQGQIVFTDPVVARYYSTYSRHKLTWKSKQPIYTYNIHCTVKEFELNNTFNPSALSGSNNTIRNNITGSEFRPYITTVGLYNEANELVAVAKTNRPIPKSENVDMTFVVKIDL